MFVLLPTSCARFRRVISVSSGPVAAAAVGELGVVIAAGAAVCAGAAEESTSDVVSGCDSGSVVISVVLYISSSVEKAISCRCKLLCPRSKQVCLTVFDK